MPQLSILFSTFTQKTSKFNLYSQWISEHTVNTSLNQSSGLRDISLREVAADSFREEAQPAPIAVACLQTQLSPQGISMNYYTIPEVANERLNVSRSTVYRLIESGDLKRVHFRTCARITAASLDAYCESRANGGAR